MSIASPLRTLLPGLEILPVGGAFGLQVFGLRHRLPSDLVYRTLDEALAAEALEITEISDGGSVPTLRLLNKSDQRVFLMAGEQLIGAKQNRVLNTSILVDAHAELPIPVSCVEQGRWSYRSAHFGSHGTASHSRLRKVLSDSVTESYTLSATPTSDQGAVWREVSRKLSSVGSSSMTMALEQCYSDTKPRLDEALRNLPVPPDCQGAVFVLHGRVLGVDIFDQPKTLAKLWSKLLMSYTLDAIEKITHAPEMSSDEVRAWLERAAEQIPQEFPSPGLGSDLRVKGTEMSGSTLVVAEQPVHMQFFAEASLAS